MIEIIIILTVFTSKIKIKSLAILGKILYIYYLIGLIDLNNKIEINGQILLDNISKL